MRTESIRKTHGEVLSSVPSFLFVSFLLFSFFFFSPPCLLFFSFSLFEGSIVEFTPRAIQEERGRKRRPEEREEGSLLWRGDR